MAEGDDEVRDRADATAEERRTNAPASVELPTDAVADETAATPLGLASDRHGCTWSRMPRFAKASEWRPVAICRDLAIARGDLEAIAAAIEERGSTKSGKKKGSNDALGRSTRKERAETAARIRAVAEALRTAEQNTHSCVATHVRAAMLCARSSEISGLGVLLDQCAPQVPHDRRPGTAGKDKDAGRAPASGGSRSAQSKSRKTKTEAADGKRREGADGEEEAFCDVDTDPLLTMDAALSCKFDE
jgi:hypothetical protein